MSSLASVSPLSPATLAPHPSTGREPRAKIGERMLDGLRSHPRQPVGSVTRQVQPH